MSSAINALTPRLSADTTGSTKSPAASLTDPLANEQTFLKLLVSQLQNQDPLNPRTATSSSRS